MTRRLSRFAWRKSVSALREDAWVESLAFLRRQRVAVTAFPGRKTIRIEAFGLSESEALLLKARFGGSVRHPGTGVPAAAKASKPVRIRGEFLVAGSRGALDGRGGMASGRKLLLIPAGAAFGTGEHATTASCLRLLCDVSKALKADRWRMLDLGTGSGILAIAAARLGAAQVEGWDFDADAIRTARENARANGAPKILLKRADVIHPFPRRQWHIVCANLYSEVLIRASLKIAAAVRAGGRLILSGILRGQEVECRSAFERRGLRLERTLRSGKWAALLLAKGSRP